MAKLKMNKVNVNGVLTEVNTEVKTDKNGKEYIGGKIVVKCVLEGVENLIEMRVFSYKMTKAGAVSKLFTAYCNLEGLINRRVRVEGEFREEKMVDQTSGTVRAFNSISAKFVNEGRNDDTDCATFEYSGFVTKGIAERRNKDDELFGYRLEVAQSNYNDTNLSVIRFDVAKDDVNVAQAIQDYYQVGTTVVFYGILSQTTRSETRTEEVAFGDPITKTRIYTDKLYRIKSGNPPFDPDDPNAYTPEEIKTLVEAYKNDNDARVLAAQSGAAATAETASSAPTSPAAAAMNRLTKMQSLI